LDTSVSQFEKFAACPFQFFVSSGLQAEERLRYELDIRQQGSFQHEVLAKFHEDLRVAGKRWRDLTPAEARNLIAETCASMLEKFEDGLLTAKEQNRFLAESYKQSLQRLIETLVGWMQQYQFDPEVVEIGFGFHDSKLPAWRIDLGQDCALLFRGRIDRVDLWRKPGHDEALCVVIDYKSSQRKLKQLYIENGLQQQLPAYLNVLRHLENGRSVFGVNRLIPAGVFYINLAGSYEFGETRADVLNSVFEDSRRAYTHEGLFNADELDKLDNRTDVSAGDQFRYSLKKDGHLAKKGLGPLSQDAFSRMLDESHARLVQMGRSLYQGDVRIDPYKCGNEVACEKCDYGSICRIDPWSHKFRTLKAVAEPEE
jgi:ATP-dependent helicase/nuclease subunit B